MREKRLHPLSVLGAAVIYISAGVTVAALLFTVGYILAKGIPNLTPALFEPHYDTKNVSMLPSVLNTLYITFLSLAAAVPVGVFAAVYLAEYTQKGSRAVRLIRLTADTLSGVPSIVYGMFGFLAFVIFLNLGYSLLSGAFTLAIMVLPTVIRTTEEALRAVPLSYREGSLALGAGKLRTIFKLILPSAAGGILSGVILSVGRITGETAALIFTSGTVARAAASPLSSGRTLSVHLYCLLSEGLYTKQAYATAAVLLAATAALNALSSFLTGRLSKI